MSWEAILGLERVSLNLLNNQELFVRRPLKDLQFKIMKLNITLNRTPTTLFVKLVRGQSSHPMININNSTK